MWELIICLGISWAGCEQKIINLIRTENECFKLAKELEEKETAKPKVIYCRKQLINTYWNNT